MAFRLNRRGFLGALSAAGAALALPGLSRAETEPAAAPFRFVHLTDIHVQEERRGAEGLACCLQRIEALDPKPDFILTGGDLVIDAYGQSHDRARSLFELYRKVLADNTDLPVRQCIGNHDVFGWANRHGVTPDHPQYGKSMVREMLDLPGTYYTFDHKGWRFFVLDDIQPGKDKEYQAFIDEAQWAWLEEQLKAKPAEMPAAAVCHIPILSITVAAARFDEEQNAYAIPASSMCRDAFKLADLFSRHNVRLALSGHIHQCDRMEFRGTTWICDGAVSGAWWKGPHHGFEEGFGLLDVRPDGALQYAYHDYGWNAEA